MGKRILFVDDEPHILESLERMLRPMRREWSMRFAEGGQEALERLREEPFDVIVTDMKMPGMDGVQLLEEVRDKYPDTVRIVLSGHCDEGMILRSVRSAHQYLSKPCDSGTLRTTVERACALHDRLGDAALKGALARIESLPSLPSLYAQMLNELSSPDASASRVAAIISQDIAMTAKVLQLVNSAFFGLSQRVSSILQAVSLLGLETVKALVLTIQIFSGFESRQVSALNLASVRRHSLRVGLFAKAIAQQTDQKLSDDAFMAGLLHDVGKLILAANFPREYSAIVEKEATEKTPSWEAESNLFGSTHAEIGAYLMGIWGLPELIIEAIAFHHAPASCPVQEVQPLSWVYFANLFEHGEYACRVRVDSSSQGADEAQTTGRIKAWRVICERIDKEEREGDGKDPVRG